MATAGTLFKNLFGRREESGTAALEFALGLPFMALLFVGMVDLGYLMYQATQLNSAVEAGAFYVLKNKWIPSTGATPIVNAVSQTGTVTGTPTASCFYGCPGATGIVSQAGVCGSGSSTPTCSNGYAPGQYVKIDARLSTTTLIDSGIFGFFGKSLVLPNPLTATTTIRSE